MLHQFCPHDITLQNLPFLQDITTMFELIGSMGADISLDENMNFKINTSNLSSLEARYELIKNYEGFDISAWINDC